MNFLSIRFFAVAVAAVLLTGCASSVQRMDQPSLPGAAVAAAPMSSDVKGITIWLNDEAKAKLADNVRFSAERLKSTVENSVKANGLLKAEASQTLDIEVTSFRVRSNFSAVMFGFMAGADNIEGVVALKDESGRVLKRSKISASYALGGLAGGQDDARLGWLYDEFAKHTLVELNGPKK